MCKLQESWQPHPLFPTNMYVPTRTFFCILEWPQLNGTELSCCTVSGTFVHPRLCTPLKKAPSTNVRVQIRHRLLLFFHFFIEFSWAVIFLNVGSLWKSLHCVEDGCANQIWPFLPKRITARCCSWWDVSPPWIERLGIILRFPFLIISSRLLCNLWGSQAAVSKSSQLQTVVVGLSPKQGPKNLCNIYETALITDCLNPRLFLSLLLWWRVLGQAQVYSKKPVIFVLVQLQNQ